MDQALFEIYERNFPFNIRKKDTVLQILGHRDNVVLERREEGKGLIGAGHDYLMPGVPTSRRYFQAENERLYENLDESAVLFFEKRGYAHSWECNCFDMMVPFYGQEQEEERISVSGDAEEGAPQAQGLRVGDQISGITYRWAQQGGYASVRRMPARNLQSTTKMRACMRRTVTREP